MTLHTIRKQARAGPVARPDDGRFRHTGHYRRLPVVAARPAPLDAVPGDDVAPVRDTARSPPSPYDFPMRTPPPIPVDHRPTFGGHASPTATDIARELISRASTAAELHSTPSHVADALRDAVSLAHRNDVAGVRALTCALEDLDAFRHIIVEDGKVIALSMYARSLLDSAYWSESNPTYSRADHERVASAVAGIDRGEESAVYALASALAREATDEREVMTRGR